MKQLTINPNNERFYSEDFIKGFKCGTQRQLEADKADIPTWIPCSERLPTKAGHYLCSFKKPKRIDNIHVELAYWTGGRWYGYVAPEIKAWMPLPQPMKGADDERKEE